jgi:hypothetical protein
VVTAYRFAVKPPFILARQERSTFRRATVEVQQTRVARGAGRATALTTWGNAGVPVSQSSQGPSISRTWRQS